MAIVLLPRKSGELKLSFLDSEQSPRVFLLGHKRQWIMLGTLVSCLLALLAAIHLIPGLSDSVQGEDPAMMQTTPEPMAGMTISEPAPIPSVPPLAAATHTRVLPFDAAHPINRGDYIVVRQQGASVVRKVVASANEALVLQRGEGVQGLYLLGRDSYLVASGRETNIVRTGEILATIVPTESSLLTP